MTPLGTVTPLRLSKSLCSKSPPLRKGTSPNMDSMNLFFEVYVPGLRVVEPEEEEVVQPVAVEVGLFGIRAVVAPEGVEVVVVAPEGEPSFPREEVDEHEAVEERLYEEPSCYSCSSSRASETIDAVDREVEDPLVLGEEFLVVTASTSNALSERRADAAACRGGSSISWRPARRRFGAAGRARRSCGEG